MNPEALIEHNTTGIDYSDRAHLDSKWRGIIDFHSHVTMTAPSDKTEGPAGGAGAEGSTESAASMLRVASTFGVETIVTMCPSQDIAPLRKAFGNRLRFNAMVIKKPDESDESSFTEFGRFLEAGVDIVKLWAAPRGRDRGLLLDQPWRRAILNEARRAGIRMVMVHVGDPDVWWTKQYLDVEKYGTKADQYVPLRRLIDDYPEFIWIGAHMGGDPEHPDHLARLMDQYPQYHLDTSATKWIVREVSKHPKAIRELVESYSTRFLFGSDLVTRHSLPEEHYVSRYWCQRTLWETEWMGESPIADPDFRPVDESEKLVLRGVGLSKETLQKVYIENAKRLLQMTN
jgi:predicted TIM-barrel fold metal-dependent hydrolase